MAARWHFRITQSRVVTEHAQLALGVAAVRFRVDADLLGKNQWLSMLLPTSLVVSALLGNTSFEERPALGYRSGKMLPSILFLASFPTFT